MRTIVGRAFYAGYHFLRGHPCTADFEFARDAGMGSHKQFLEWLGGRANLEIVFAGRLLGKLRSFRVEADYIIGSNLRPGIDEDAVETAEQIVEEVLAEYDAE